MTSSTVPLSNTPLSDRELLTAFVGMADGAAFAAITERHLGLVYGTAFRRTRSREMAQEAAQNTFCRLARHAPRVWVGASLAPWLHAVALREAGTLMRAESARQRALDRLAAFAAAEDGGPAIRSAPPGSEHLDEALAALPEAARRVLILRYLQGLSLREVALEEDTSEEAARKRVTRALDRLTRLLARRGVTAAGVTACLAAAPVLWPAPSTAAALAGRALEQAAMSAAGLTAPVITTMTSSKLSFCTAALAVAACLPLGYAVHRGTEPPPPSAGEARGGTLAAASASPDSAFKDSALFAEWLRLHEEHGHDAAAMPALFQAIQEGPDPFRRRAFRSALVAEWAQVDPAGGLDFLLLDQNGDEHTPRQLFGQWLKRDPQAAMAKLRTTGAAGDTLAAQMLTDIAKAAPEEVPAIAAKLPPAKNRDRAPAVADAFAFYAEKNPEAARAAAEALAGHYRGEALEGVAKAWAKRDMDAVIAWTATLPDGTDRDSVLRSALAGLASVDPAAALEKIGIVPPGGQGSSDTTADRLMGAIGEKDFDIAARWLRDHPGKTPGQNHQGLAHAAGLALNADPVAFLDRQLAEGTLKTIGQAVNLALMGDANSQLGKVWEWLKQHPDEASLEHLRESVARSAIRQGTDLAMKIAREAPAGKEGDDVRRTVAQSLLHDGEESSRMEELLGKAPEALRADLIRVCFGSLQANNLSDPARWVARLESIPEAERAGPAKRLAFVWAGQNPAEAAHFAAGLPQGGGRSDALRNVAGAWMKQDALAASEWIATLPAGPDRDAGADIVVNEILEDSPSDAWEWAVSITAPALRLHCGGQALRSLAESDPAEAARLITASALSEPEKQQLRAAAGLSTP
ncbi:MAG: sigma-70 family RNA polymerase sigma factor [Verrucomicrobiota bacterium]